MAHNCEQNKTSPANPGFVWICLNMSRWFIPMATGCWFNRLFMDLHLSCRGVVEPVDQSWPIGISIKNDRLSWENRLQMVENRHPVFYGFLLTVVKKKLGVFGDKKVPSEIMSHRCLERTEQTTNDGMFGKCQYEFCSGLRFWTKQRPLPFNYPNCIKLLSISKSRFLRILWVHSLDSSALDPKSDHKTTVCLTVRCRLLGHTDFSLR